MSLLDLFRRFQTLLGICPCCGRWFKLSDAQLFISKAPTATPFDELAQAQAELEAAISRFDEREERVRSLAREKGRLLARRRLKKIAGWCSEGRFDPNDVKVLFDPVEYVVFAGLSSRGCSRVAFVDRPPKSRQKELLLESLGRAIRRGNVEWHTYRVTDDGEVSVEK
jgi:predicted Holliday junction resolvase-like endonuclease